MKTNTRAAKVVVSRVLVQSLLVVLMMALPCASSDAASSQEHKKVLLLSSHDSNLPAAIIIEQSLRTSLKSGSPVGVEVYAEYLDSTRTQLGDYEQELIAMLRRKYEGQKFDLIIAIDAPALRVLSRNEHEIFQDIPIVFMALDERTLSDLVLGPNMTGVWGDVHLKPNLELALGLHPETKKVVVVAGVSEFDKYWTTKAREDFRAFEGKLEFTYLIGLTIAEYQKALASLPEHSIVFLMTVTRDNAGNNYLNVDVLRQISPVTSVPIYGTTDAQLGLGIVGGRLVSFKAIGAQMAQMGLRVLAGEQPQAIAPHGTPSVVMFDWRELRRWGISEESLPPGSDVRFKGFTFWEQYRWRIIGLLAFSVIEALLIAVLLVERRRRWRAIIQLDERVRFESLLSKLSAEFADLPASKVDMMVKQWLDRLKDFWGEVTISFFEVPRSDGAVIAIPSEDTLPLPRTLAVNDLKEDEWCLDQLLKGTTINLPNVPAALSSEKIGEKTAANLKSLLAIPVAVNGTTFALALGTTRSYRTWPEDQVSQLRLVGEIFAGVLERKRGGEELRRTRDDLAHVARLTAMGEMAASIAHEVNQPLSAIATYGDACVLLLSGESPNVKKSLEAIDHIIKDSMRASEVVKRIRGLVKKTSHETAPQDLNQMILDMVAMTDADMQARSVQLELHLAHGLPWVLGDRVELQQVMLNLILNAFEAMSAIADRARKLTITTSRNGEAYVVVTVQDSGVGLNSEQPQHIFEPFVTTKTQGLGLGLSISRTILEAHGGRLWAEPNKGPGARFQFTLPTPGAELQWTLAQSSTSSTTIPQCETRSKCSLKPQAST